MLPPSSIPLLALLLASAPDVPSGSGALTPVLVFEGLYLPGASNGAGLGAAVAIMGDTVAAGAPGDDNPAANAGSVGIWVDVGNAFEFQQRLVAWDADGGEAFGSAVALDGGRLAVGAPGESTAGLLTGAVYTFTWSGTSWVPEEKLIAASLSGAPTLGRRVALLGADLAAVGQSDNGIDAVFVFNRGTGNWLQQDFFEPHAGVPGGWSHITGLDLGAGVCAAGVPSDFDAGFASTGSASVYRRAGSAWSLETREHGQVDDWLGYAVALDSSGTRLAASALLVEELHTWSESGGLWTSEALLPNPFPGGADEFGYSLDLDGPLLVVGERQDDTAATDAGRVQVFEDAGSGFQPTCELFPSGSTLAGARFGQTLDLDGTRLAVGAPGWLSGDGSFFVFEFRPPTVGSVYCTAGSSAFGCEALISAQGTPSATAPSGFILYADFVNEQRDGLFFFGTNGSQAVPFGNSSSFRCVVPPVKRTPKLTGAGIAGFECHGHFAFDLNAHWCPTCPKPSKNPGAGAVVNVQFWYRDPQNTSNQVSAYSNAVEVLIGL